MPASWSTSGLYDGCDLRPIVDTENQISEINSTVSYFIDATDPHLQPFLAYHQDFL